MEVELVTEKGILFKKEAQHVRACGEKGDMGILNNHTPLLSPLKSGKIRVDKNEFDIKKGFLKVSDNSIIILLEQ